MCISLWQDLAQDTNNNTQAEETQRNISTDSDKCAALLQAAGKCFFYLLILFSFHASRHWFIAFRPAVHSCLRNVSVTAAVLSGMIGNGCAGPAHTLVDACFRLQQGLVCEPSLFGNQKPSSSEVFVQVFWYTGANKSLIYLLKIH